MKSFKKSSIEESVLNKPIYVEFDLGNSDWLKHLNDKRNYLMDGKQADSYESPFASHKVTLAFKPNNTKIINNDTHVLSQDISLDNIIVDGELSTFGTLSKSKILAHSDDIQRIVIKVGPNGEIPNIGTLVANVYTDTNFSMSRKELDYTLNSVSIAQGIRDSGILELYKEMPPFARAETLNQNVAIINDLVQKMSDGINAEAYSVSQDPETGANLDVDQWQKISTAKIRDISQDRRNEIEEAKTKILLSANAEKSYISEFQLKNNIDLSEVSKFEIDCYYKYTRGRFKTGHFFQPNIKDERMEKILDLMGPSYKCDLKNSFYPSPDLIKTNLNGIKSLSQEQRIILENQLQEGNLKENYYKKALAEGQRYEETGETARDLTSKYLQDIGIINDKSIEGCKNLEKAISDITENVKSGVNDGFSLEQKAIIADYLRELYVNHPENQTVKFQRNPSEFAVELKDAKFISVEDYLTLQKVFDNDPTQMKGFIEDGKSVYRELLDYTNVNREVYENSKKILENGSVKMSSILAEIGGASSKEILEHPEVKELSQSLRENLLIVAKYENVRAILDRSTLKYDFPEQGITNQAMIELMIKREVFQRIPTETSAQFRERVDNEFIKNYQNPNWVASRLVQIESELLTYKEKRTVEETTSGNGKFKQTEKIVEKSGLTSGLTSSEVLCLEEKRFLSKAMDLYLQQQSSNELGKIDVQQFVQTMVSLDTPRVLREKNLVNEEFLTRHQFDRIPPETRLANEYQLKNLEGKIEILLQEKERIDPKQKDALENNQKQIDESRKQCANIQGALNKDIVAQRTHEVLQGFDVSQNNFARIASLKGEIVDENGNKVMMDNLAHMKVENFNNLFLLAARADTDQGKEEHPNQDRFNEVIRLCKQNPEHIDSISEISKNPEISTDTIKAYVEKVNEIESNLNETHEALDKEYNALSILQDDLNKEMDDYEKRRDKDEDAEKSQEHIDLENQIKEKESLIKDLEMTRDALENQQEILNSSSEISIARLAGDKEVSDQQIRDLIENVGASENATTRYTVESVYNDSVSHNFNEENMEMVTSYEKNKTAERIEATNAALHDNLGNMNLAMMPGVEKALWAEGKYEVIQGLASGDKIKAETADTFSDKVPHIFKIENGIMVNGAEIHDDKYIEGLKQKLDTSIKTINELLPDNDVMISKSQIYSSLLNDETRSKYIDVLSLSPDVNVLKVANELKEISNIKEQLPQEMFEETCKHSLLNHSNTYIAKDSEIIETAKQEHVSTAHEQFYNGCVSSIFEKTMLSENPEISKSFKADLAENYQNVLGYCKTELNIELMRRHVSDLHFHQGHIIGTSRNTSTLSNDAVSKELTMVSEEIYKSEGTLLGLYKERDSYAQGLKEFADKYDLSDKKLISAFSDVVGIIDEAKDNVHNNPIVDNEGRTRMLLSDISGDLTRAQKDSGDIKIINDRGESLSSSAVTELSTSCLDTLRESSKQYREQILQTDKELVETYYVTHGLREHLELEDLVSPILNPGFHRDRAENIAKISQEVFADAMKEKDQVLKTELASQIDLIKDSKEAQYREVGNAMDSIKDMYNQNGDFYQNDNISPLKKSIIGVMAQENVISKGRDEAAKEESKAEAFDKFERIKEAAKEYQNLTQGKVPQFTYPEVKALLEKELVTPQQLLDNCDKSNLITLSPIASAYIERLHEDEKFTSKEFESSLSKKELAELKSETSKFSRTSEETEKDSEKDSSRDGDEKLDDKKTVESFDLEA